MNKSHITTSITVAFLMAAVTAVTTSYALTVDSAARLEGNATVTPRATINTNVRANVEARVEERQENKQERESTREDINARIEAQKEEQKEHAEARKEMQEEREKTIEAYGDAKTRFLDLKIKWNNASDEEKGEMRSDMTVRAKAFLQKSVDTLLSKMDHIKRWVTNNPRITDDVEASVTAKIDTEEASIKAEVAALDNEGTTLADIQAMSARIREKLVSYHETIQDVVATMKTNRLDHSREELISIATNLDAKLDVYEEKGVDLSIQQETLVRIMADIETATTPEELRSAFADMKELIVSVKAAVNAHGDGDTNA